MAERSTVLVVDDQPENIHVLLQALQAEYAVLAATDGEKALSLARRQPPPDVILLDVVMPGMDGYEVCRRLKAAPETADIPVLFVTSRSEAQDEATGLALGAIDYIAKPVNPDLLRARVANHIALRQAARLKEDVQRMLRHDLRGPLVGVIGLPRMLLREAQLSPEHREMLELIEQAGQRTLRLLNMSLDLYKMEQGVYSFLPAPVDLAQIARDVLAELAGLAASLQVALVLEHDGAPLHEDAVLFARAEPLLCHSMLANLGKNALEASAPGDVVTVFLDAEVQGEGRARLAVHNPAVVPEGLRSRFGEKYATFGKTGGTGLGVYSARLMAQTMGGEFSWSSDATAGTSISVRLPLAGEQPIEAVAAPAAAPSATGPRVRVLVVDDDLQAGLLLRRQLQAMGHEVELAGHGEEALARFEPGSFHLVFMDREMPVMDGLATGKALRRKEREAGPGRKGRKGRTGRTDSALLVGLTGHDAPHVHQEMLQAGFDRSLQKPLLPEQLAAVLAAAGSSAAPVVLWLEADVQELAGPLLETLRREQAELEAALQRGDWEVLRSQGHKRKGTCRAYGLAPLVDGYAALERAAAAAAHEAGGHAVPHAVPQAKDAAEALAGLGSLLERLELRYTAS